MRRALFFLFCLFCAAFCFAQQNANFRVIGRVPDAGDYRVYQIQVGAFQIFQNAEEAFSRLKNASFNPAYESFSYLTRVVINGVAARDVPSYLGRLQNTGFAEVIIRIDNSRAAEQPPAFEATAEITFVPDDEVIIIRKTTPVPQQSPQPQQQQQPLQPAQEVPSVRETPAPQPQPVQEVPRARETPAPQQSLLPAPGDRYPEDGHRIGTEELRQQRGIDFRWGAVEGATSYVVTIYRETPQGRTPIFTSPEPLEQTNYTLDNLELFENTGSYVWRVEALYNRQRGRPGENKFTFNVPHPGQVQTRDTGVLYGN
jgi:hypothetical protein